MQPWQVQKWQTLAIMFWFIFAVFIALIVALVYGVLRLIGVKPPWRGLACAVVAILLLITIVFVFYV